MNTTKRFLILNHTNTAQCPSAHGFVTPGLQGDKSPSFLSADSAKKFADFLASTNKGQRYYLAEVVAATVQYSEPVEPGAWTDTKVDDAE